MIKGKNGTIVHVPETNLEVLRRSITVEEVAQAEDMEVTAKEEETDHQAVSIRASTAVTSTAAVNQVTVVRVMAIEGSMEIRR